MFNMIFVLLTTSVQDKVVPDLTPRVIYSRKTLGTEAWATLNFPFKVTVQAVSRLPSQLAPKITMLFGQPQPISLVGPERTVSIKHADEIASAMRSPVYIQHKFCGFSPDHVITFSRGNDSFQLITCFGCSDMLGQFNGKAVGFGPLVEPAKSLIHRSFTKQEHGAATIARGVPSDVLLAINSAKSAQVLRTKPFETIYQWPSNLKWEEAGSLRKNDLNEIRGFFNVAAYEAFAKITYRIEPTDIKNAYLLRFDSKPVVELLLMPGIPLFVCKLNGENVESFLSVAQSYESIIKFVDSKVNKI